MTEQPTQEPFEPYRPGPSGGEQPHPQSQPQSSPPAQSPPPWAAQQPNPYGGSYGPGYGTGRQMHPQANLVLVLGLVSLFFALVGPVAWVLGSRAKKEIAASGGRLDGMSQVTIGYVMGIVMTVLTALGVLVVLGFFLIVFVMVLAGA